MALEESLTAKAEETPQPAVPGLDRIEVILVAAVAKNDVIGDKGTMPWHYPEDLKRFKEVTSGPGKVMLMGRKTWESIPPSKKTGERLPGRKLLVLSNQERENEENTMFVKELSGKTFSNLYSLGIRQLYVIGGSTMFSRYFHTADRAYITHIDKEYEGDTKFHLEVFNMYFEPVQSEKLAPELTFTEYKARKHVLIQSPPESVAQI